MGLTMWLPGIAAACLAGISSATAAEPAPNIHGETVEQVAERTGYTAEEVRASFPPIEKWQVQPRPGTPADSFARERFKAPPKPGVHPRVYFGPGDLPAIRRRLKQTQVGRLRMAGIRGRLLQLSPTRADWESVPYKPKEEDYRRYAARGLHIQPRMGYRGAWLGGWVNELAKGDVPEQMEADWPKRLSRNPRGYLMHLLPYEAFRCLIDEDAAAGRRVAAALTTIARRYAKDMARWQKTDNWQLIYWQLHSHSIGLTYDWAHRWMTDGQRATVRRCIAGITKGKRYLGLDHLPSYPGNTSNWNIIHANLLPMVLAIEGEAGYDSAVYARIVEGLRKWVYVASGPEGAPFEGLTKSAYGAVWLLPLAMRGEALIGSQWAKAHARRFLLHTMLPRGGEHVFETGIGPLQRDIRYFKHAHPSDPVVDVLYGSFVRESFAPGARGGWPNVRTSYAPPWDLFVADDPAGAAGASYDYGKALDGLLGELAKREPLTYFSDYRGLIVTRSAWTKDAAFLYFEPRNVPGGHTRASRNEFVFASHGRVWAHRTVAVEDTSELHSVVLIDGRGQGKSGGRCPAGRTVAFADTPAATFAAADAVWAYSHVLVPADRKGAEPIALTPNDSRLRPGPLPWMDRPWSFLPNWATGCKPAAGRDPGGHGWWEPYNPVRHAYRTCGLVRSERPYVLIVDDVRKDDAEHDYTWLMQIPDDVILVSKTPCPPSRKGVVDLLLGDEPGRRLLVRVLAAGSSPAEAKGTADGAKLETFEKTFRNRTTTHQRLTLPLRAVVGHFKILLLPLREGESPPQTTLSADGTTLSIIRAKQKDTFTFHVAKDGRTRVTMKRDGKQTLTVQ